MFKPAALPHALLQVEEVRRGLLGLARVEEELDALCASRAARPSAVRAGALRARLGRGPRFEVSRGAPALGVNPGAKTSLSRLGLPVLEPKPKALFGSSL